MPAAPGHVGLATQPAFHAHFARHRGHLIGEGGQRVGHVVDGFGQRRDFALGVDRQLLRQLTVGDSGHDFDDAAHLLGQVGRHDVDVVGQIFPGSGHAGHLGLAAEFAVRADFAGHARHFGGEGVELVHHGVDGVLQFENFAFHVDGDLARQVAARHGGRDFGDVSYLRRQVSGHGVDGIGEIFPGSGHAGHVGLSAQPAFAAHFAGHASDFGGERAQLLDHGVQRFFELQDFAAHVHGDLLGKVAGGDGGCHFGDVAHLASQVAGHEVDVVGEIFPGSADTRHLRLAAQLAFGADFARHARDFAGEGVELVHHRVDGVLQLENFAFHVHRDLARQIAAGHGRRDLGNVAHLRRSGFRPWNSPSR